MIRNDSRTRLKFEGCSLKQEDTAHVTLNSVASLFIIYELDTWLREINTDVTLKDYLFRSEKLIENADPDKYKYSGYGIGFDSRLEF